MTEEQIRHFETLGFFLWKQLLSPDEIRVLSDAFDVAMRKARGEEEDPELRQDEGGNSARRQQTIPFSTMIRTRFILYSTMSDLLTSWKPYLVMISSLP